MQSQRLIKTRFLACIAVILCNVLFVKTFAQDARTYLPGRAISVPGPAVRPPSFSRTRFALLETVLKDQVERENLRRLSEFAQTERDKLGPGERRVFDIWVMDLGRYGASVVGFSPGDVPSMRPEHWRLATVNELPFFRDGLTVEGPPLALIETSSGPVMTPSMYRNWAQQSENAAQARWRAGVMTQQDIQFMLQRLEAARRSQAAHRLRELEQRSNELLEARARELARHERLREQRTMRELVIRERIQSIRESSAESNQPSTEQLLKRGETFMDHHRVPPKTTRPDASLKKWILP